MMQRQLDWSCPQHGDPADCPDSVVAALSGERWGLRIHDGGSSYIRIRYCPWCATQLSDWSP